MIRIYPPGVPVLWHEPFRGIRLGPGPAPTWRAPGSRPLARWSLKGDEVIAMDSSGWE